MSLKLTGKQLKGLQTTLLKAFPGRSNLEQMMLFELDTSLNDVSGPGNQTNVVFELIQWAIAQGRLEELIAGARAANPGNPDLKAFVLETCLFADTLPAPGGAVAGQLQALVTQGPGLAGVGVRDWRARSMAAERSICRLERGPKEPVGTGFLVSADIVMTNAHVAEQLLQPGGTPQARFDYISNDDFEGTSVVALAPGDAQLALSPVDELDYALLHLAGKVGDALVEGQPRGRLRPAKHDFVKDEPILIVQHPGGAAQQVSVGYLRDVNHQTGRIAYTVNTEPGSSGSPCFSMGWQLIGLHHHGDSFTNHGMPMSAILEDLAAKGVAGLLA